MQAAPQRCSRDYYNTSRPPCAPEQNKNSVSFARGTRKLDSEPLADIMSESALAAARTRSDRTTASLSVETSTSKRHYRPGATLSFQSDCRPGRRLGLGSVPGPARHHCLLVALAAASAVAIVEGDMAQCGWHAHCHWITERIGFKSSQPSASPSESPQSPQSLQTSGSSEAPRGEYLQRFALRALTKSTPGRGLGAHSSPSTGRGGVTHTQKQGHWQQPLARASTAATDRPAVAPSACQ